VFAVGTRHKEGHRVRVVGDGALSCSRLSHRQVEEDTQGGECASFISAPSYFGLTPTYKSNLRITELSLISIGLYQQVAQLVALLSDHRTVFRRTWPDGRFGK
jgi:hypothetical protein